MMHPFDNTALGIAASAMRRRSVEKNRDRFPRHVSNHQFSCFRHAGNSTKSAIRLVHRREHLRFPRLSGSNPHTNPITDQYVAV
jgi:hypothetical protein